MGIQKLKIEKHTLFRCDIKKKKKKRDVVDTQEKLEYMSGTTLHVHVMK